MTTPVKGPQKERARVLQDGAGNVLGTEDNPLHFAFSQSEITGDMTVGGELSVGEDASVGGDLAVTGDVGCASVTDAGLTAGRVTYAGAAGLLKDDAGLTYDDAADALAVTGTVTATGDLAAAGGFKQQVGPFYGQLAADETQALKLGDTAGQGWVAPAAGSLMGCSAMLDTAVTGSSKTATLRVYKNGSLFHADFDLAFTSGGAEVKKYATVAKDVRTFAAGDVLTVVDVSNTITSTPKAVAYLMVEC